MIGGTLFEDNMFVVDLHLHLHNISTLSNGVLIDLGPDLYVVMCFYASVENVIE